MLLSNSPAGSRKLIGLVCLALFATCMATMLWSQATISTGSVQGTVVDPNGAVVPNAPVTITNKATGAALKTNTNGSGNYATGALQPGTYEVRIETKGFRTQVLTVTVQVGVVTTANATLTLGQTSEVVEVTGTAVAVNTEQATVQGVLTAEQIETLPINGRNFLDLAQLEPGVQIQDGGNFDPTKNGFSSISFGGRFGRTARIEVDGIDISDETVGTTTQNLPASAIQEFQVSQSSLDMSTELTSSGAVNVVTKSGTNKWHGQGFYLFRDHSLDALTATQDLYFQRNNFGGDLGGPIIKDKLFFFADVERLRQVANDPVVSSGALASNVGSFNAPFKDTNGVAKLDWKITDNFKMFGRFSYEQNISIKGFIPNSFQPFENVNHTPVYVAGVDFDKGSYTNQFRFGFTKFRNGITDATKSGIFNPDPLLSITIGPSNSCLAGGVDSFCSGSNLLAPQETFQENTQFKYDGSKIMGSHIIRYGAGINHIQGGGFAKFFALAPTVNSLTEAVPIPGTTQFTAGVQPCGGAITTNCIANIFPGGAANPLNYPAQLVIMGNGQGFSSELPAFGLPGGGLGPDNRLQLYLGDSWKIRPNLTLTYGLRYIHDTGRTDADLGSLPCSTLSLGGTILSPAQQAQVQADCASAGNILNMWGTGLGNPVRDPALNFAPNFGFAWDPSKAGKFVVRGGIGLYYDNSIYNNNLFDRPGRLASGLFLGEAVPCSNGSPTNFAMPDGSPVPVNLAAVCGAPMGTVDTQLAQLQTAFQAATLKSGAAANANYIGTSLFASNGNNGIAMFAPNYQTPRSVQMNVGVEKQLSKGIVWTADYIRNVGTHTLLAVDTNHVGDVRFFNKANAVAAVNATVVACGAPNLASAIAPGGCPGLHPASGGSPAGSATVGDFASNGLGDANNIGACNSGPCPFAAFEGQNPLLGTNQMLFSAGRSVLNAFDTSIRANVSRPFTGVRAMSWQVSYSLSRYDATAQDSDFVNNALNNNNPTSAFGPDGLDRTHQFSFGGSFDFPGYIRFGIIGHVYSPLPLNLTLPTDAGGILTSDPTGSGAGDGTASYNGLGGLVPGTNLGAYGRSISPGGLASFITNYNNTVAGTPTPAGQTLINSGVFTLAQLQTIGAVLPTLDMPPSVQGLGWLRTVDLRLSYPRKIREGMSIEPSVSIFNAFNMSNFDAPGLTLSGVMNSGPGSVNGSMPSDHLTTRVLPGSGVYDLGAPRVVEFGLKFQF